MAEARHHDTMPRMYRKAPNYAKTHWRMLNAAPMQAAADAIKDGDVVGAVRHINEFLDTPRAAMLKRQAGTQNAKPRLLQHLREALAAARARRDHMIDGGDNDSDENDSDDAYDDDDDDDDDCALAARAPAAAAAAPGAATAALAAAAARAGQPIPEAQEIRRRTERALPQIGAGHLSRAARILLQGPIAECTHPQQA